MEKADFRGAITYERVEITPIVGLEYQRPGGPGPTRRGIGVAGKQRAGPVYASLHRGRRPNYGLRRGLHRNSCLQATVGPRG